MMKGFLGALYALVALPAIAEPVDMTGLACTRATNFGTQHWEFYDELAIRYYDDGGVSLLPRIGLGAYEKSNEKGEWTAIYYFFDSGDGIQVRILARAGEMKRLENPRAPLESGISPLNGNCSPILPN